MACSGGLGPGFPNLKVWVKVFRIKACAGKGWLEGHIRFGGLGFEFLGVGFGVPYGSEPIAYM